MNNNSAHNNIDHQSKAFFAGGTFRWKTDKEQVWSAVEKAMAQKPAGRRLVLGMRRSILAMAAVLLLLIGLGTFMRLYTVRIDNPVGQHLMANLPDGSSVYLNADSYIEYNPYWWQLKRQVKFEGEALFEVQKGKAFEVISVNGRTEVLGTSFNIYARETDYAVTCLSGSVKVTAPSKNSVVLQPQSKASVQPDGQIQVQHKIETLPEISWKDNYFRFTASPINEVFREIERQYGITIKTDIAKQSLYTGSFNRTNSIDQVMEIVCPPMGLSYQKQPGGFYLITQNNE
ncbi:MAG TPA: FecR family protein [Prolixibacteraceae bacterium]|nr:FecR family protein [Prolixibacteraceae bacterium]HPR59577.1 FecR family protein [Prolixibacteraceae bacterium]